MRLRILADDLTGALDCAAAFGSGVPVNLGRPAQEEPEGIDIVATATRDVFPSELPRLLTPSIAWLRGADIAFKKVDSLLRGNTFEEVDLIARHGRFAGLAMAPAFPAQGRITLDGQQWWEDKDGVRTSVAASLSKTLQAHGWKLIRDPKSGASLSQESGLAWVPNVLQDNDLKVVAAHAIADRSGWLWCGSAGLAHALARELKVSMHGSCSVPRPREGHVMLISASYQQVSQTQWKVLRNSPRAQQCHQGEDPASLVRVGPSYPHLIDLSASRWMAHGDASALLAEQAQAIAQNAPRPRTLVVVGGDTLLALCRATGAQSLLTETPLDRLGWGAARLVGGRWDGLVCHTRSGAFGGPTDLSDVLDEFEE